MLKYKQIFRLNKGKNREQRIGKKKPQTHTHTQQMHT